MLRQLRDAPDDLRIETKFTRTSKTTTVLLGDVRDAPKEVLLQDDPRREPREFCLSLARPMGTKKGTGPGAFITETRRQAIDFYRDLVQYLTDWQPKAPRLREPKPKPSEEPADRTLASGDWETPPAATDADASAE